MIRGFTALSPVLVAFAAAADRLECAKSNAAPSSVPGPGDLISGLGICIAGRVAALDENLKPITVDVTVDLPTTAATRPETTLVGPRAPQELTVTVRIVGATETPDGKYP